MNIRYKVLFYFCIILCVMYSCKSYKELIVENKCGNKRIELTKERPFKVTKKGRTFILSFISGFNESKVKVVVNDSIYMDKELTSGSSIEYAGDLILKEYTEFPVIIYVDDDCFNFYLDENYVYYEIHTSEKKFYINIQHFPSIGE